ncbi:MAG: cache domain-containing protein [Marinobacterium sp.]
MRLRITLIGLLTLWAACSAALAAPSANPQEESRALALLERAITHYEKDPEKALAAFSRQGEFVDGDLYVYVLDGDGEMLASGGPSVALVGRNVTDVKDVTGKPFFRELLNRAREDPSGNVEYRWLNRKDNTVQRKLALFKRVGVVRRNPRNFRQPSSSPATSASRSMNLPSVWKV